ncbi:hypothetical protein J6O86_02980 [bacterium]|nr:hypothetical protein [bacterium]
MTKQATDNRVETKLTQEQINATPKEVLEHLFLLSEDRRNAYEESENGYRNKINRIENEVIPTMQNELANETNPKYIRGYKANIKHYMNLVAKCKSELKLIHENENTLWENALKISNKLGYGLEE